MIKRSDLLYSGLDDRTMADLEADGKLSDNLDEVMQLRKTDERLFNEFRRILTEIGISERLKVRALLMFVNIAATQEAAKNSQIRIITELHKIGPKKWPDFFEVKEALDDSEWRRKINEKLAVSASSIFEEM